MMSNKSTLRENRFSRWEENHFFPSIRLNRLAVFKDGWAVYDEKFKPGVNIIRGKNSSGKSTIADFIFYALGGDVSKWKDEAKGCDYTFAEIALNNAPFTFKREIKENGRPGMDIFAGPFEQAYTSAASGWLRYPYQATDHKESYYQAVLKELGIPYTKSSDNNSITLHQLLRLMYVDQMTSLERVFKFLITHKPKPFFSGGCSLCDNPPVVTYF